ncbi:asparaginase [Halopolyspora algeriensis]|uniref:Asparaginase n=1 Tax=Halopolyspora algeriensis TaxID=1500506 RepID=A0A368W4S2_9ACTN|nr:asparaginase [Halopolyspora algeriensis]RCW47050.1 asparaginase [Halopolyspora algeriensis]TQM48137.1 asparaginase [Halopolyspora algeriensis]
MTIPTSPIPLVELVRNGLREGVHHGSVVVLGPDGSVRYSAGDVTTPMYPRSSNKPAQAAGMLRAGLDLPEDADLAVAAASHSGEPAHLLRIRDLLQRHGLTEAALQCPTDWPLRETERDERAAERSGKQRITMNCSGKHAAMLATCVQRGWAVEDYLDPKHPLQVTLHNTIAELAGEPIVATGVDGCGAPLLSISLTGLARSFANLVPSGSPQRRVADAMRAHPWLVAGTEREDTRLMQAVPGLLSKSGAEGVLAMALPDGHAVAIKISDGAARARVPVAVGALRAFGPGNAGGVDDEWLTALAEEPLLGGGKPVGTVRLLPGAFG